MRRHAENGSEGCGDPRDEAPGKGDAGGLVALPIGVSNLVIRTGSHQI